MFFLRPIFNICSGPARRYLIILVAGLALLSPITSAAQTTLSKKWHDTFDFVHAGHPASANQRIW